MSCLQAHPYIFWPRNVMGLGSEGVKHYLSVERYLNTWEFSVKRYLNTTEFSGKKRKKKYPSCREVSVERYLNTREFFVKRHLNTSELSAERNQH